MLRAPAVASVLLLASCGGVVVPSAPRDTTRDALVSSLCEPLPSRAFDCVVGWPASISPARRDAVLGESEGQSWASAAGVRAFASCADRPASEGPVAHVIVIAMDTSVGSPEQIAARLPVSVRWTEACEGDACASYVGRTEGDRLVLTRRVAQPWDTAQNVAHLACAALRDGAVEAHARIDDEDALVRELRVEETGVALVTRRPGGRGGGARTHRTWTELELVVLDERIAHDASVRIAAAVRPIDPEAVDVTNAAALDQQLHTRVRRLARDSSSGALRELARLAERGFEAHPSRPDLGVLAVESYVRAHDASAAATALEALRAVIGADAPELARLELLTAIAAEDSVTLTRTLGAAAPDLSAEEIAAVADALAEQIGAHASEDGAAARATDAARAFVGAARAAHVALRRRAAVSVSANGAPWAIRALSPGTASGLLAVCGTTELETSLAQQSSWRGGAMTVATLGSCGVALVEPGAPFELGAAAQGLLGVVGADVRILVEIDGRFVGVRGRVDAARTVRIDGATPDLARADLDRAGRLVAGPLSAIGAQMFPAPTLRVPFDEAERDAAVRTASAIDSVWCERTESGVSCRLESGESVDRFVDVAEAMFRAE